MAANNDPAEQLELPEAVYPLSHAGWHVAPEAKFAAHVPTPPWVGAADALHASGKQVASCNVPSQVEAPET